MLMLTLAICTTVARLFLQHHAQRELSTFTICATVARRFSLHHAQHEFSSFDARRLHNCRTAHFHGPCATGGNCIFSMLKCDTVVKNVGVAINGSSRQYISPARDALWGICQDGRVVGKPASLPPASLQINPKSG